MLLWTSGIHHLLRRLEWYINGVVGFPCRCLVFNHLIASSLPLSVEAILFSSTFPIGFQSYDP